MLYNAADFEVRKDPQNKISASRELWETCSIKNIKIQFIYLLNAKPFVQALIKIFSFYSLINF